MAILYPNITDVPVFNKIADVITAGPVRAILTDQLIGGTDIVLTATTAFNTNWGSSITQHAIEDGAPITDNIKLNPYTITLTCMITQELKWNDILNPLTIKEVEDQIYRWRAEKQILFLIYGAAYGNVVIRNLTQFEEQGVSNAINFDITLQQLRIATSELVGGEIADKGKTEKIQDTENETAAAEVVS